MVNNVMKMIFKVFSILFFGFLISLGDISSGSRDFLIFSCINESRAARLVGDRRRHSEFVKIIKAQPWADIERVTSEHG